MPQNAERRQTTNEDTPKYLHGSAGSEYVLEWHAAKMPTYEERAVQAGNCAGARSSSCIEFFLQRLAFCMREDAVGTKTSLALRDLTCPMSSGRAISFAPW